MELGDNEDILGQPTLPVVNQSQQSSWFPGIKSFFALVGLFVLYTIGMRIRREILVWRERSYKLETRRRHGIPDNDRRPFNVAYAAAMLAREEKEKEDGNRRRRQLLQPVRGSPALDHHDAHAEQSVKSRSDRFRSTTSVAFPGAYVSSFGSNPSSSLSKSTMTGSFPYSPTKSGSTDPHSPRKSTGQAYTDYQTTGQNRHAARKIIDLTSDGDARKRGFDEQEFDEAEPAKKSRIEGNELIDGDEDALWDDSENAAPPKRASKRTLGEEDHGNDKARDKRARKVSLEKKSEMEAEEMDIDEEFDELHEMVSPVRGKKRDRAEAGSTFGGDDDDSAHEDDAKVRRHRKRRTVAKRKSDAIATHGRKRDRDVDLDDEDMGSPSDAGLSRHKKGKRHSHVPRNDSDDYRLGSDISIDDSLVSSTTRTRRRHIGEEWESNGIRYKIGLNGQRLRQALVKKARNKFVMPKDSVHPDRNANLEVFVETWLTEEEFEEAKEQMLLAWQDSPKQSAEPESLTVTIPLPKETPTRPVGKNLLWQSATSTPNSSPATASPLDSPYNLPTFRPKGLRNPHRYSLGTNVGLRINPFEKPSSITTKRIVSASIVNAPLAGSPGLSDKTNSTLRPRNLSKWEKQEVEANAIYQLRAVKQAEIDAKLKAEKEKAEKERQEKDRLERERQEKERQLKERLDKEKKEKEAAAAAAAAPKVPTITVTQPSESGVEAPKLATPAFSFGPTPAASSAPAPPAPSGAALASTFFAPPASSTTAARSTSFEPPKAPAVSPSSFSFKPTGSSASQGGAAPPASTFSFGPSTSTSHADKLGSTTQPPSTSSPAFSFGPSTSTSPFGAPTQPSVGEKKDIQQGPTPFAPSAAAQAQKSGPTSSAPLFSFKPTPGGSVFGQPSSSGAATASSQPSSTTAPAHATTNAPKFNFFATPSNPATTNGTAKAPTTLGSSSLTGALGGQQGSASNAAVPPPAGFSFKAPAPASEISKPVAAPTTAPKFNFAAPPTFGSSNANGGSVFGSATALGSAFGSSNVNAASASGAAASAFGQPQSASSFGNQDKGKDAAKPSFGGFGPTTVGGTGGSIFGGNTSGSSNAFGAPSKPFQNGNTATGATSSTQISKPTFSFGPTPSSTAPANETPKPAFAFSPTTTTTPAGNPTSTGSGGPGFSFNFSKPGATTPTTTPQASPFGAPATSAASATPNVFGASAQPLSAFGFGTPNANAGSTTPSGTPAFSFGNPQQK